MNYVNNYHAFRFYTKFVIKGVIGAIDCTHIAIAAPPIHDPVRPARLYMNRKGYYSINVEAICDSNLKYMSVNARFPGSTHDSAIWSISAAAARISLIREYSIRRLNWLLGDGGYPLEPWLLTPYPTPHTSQEEKFNKMHKKARNVVERAFGVLKSRFRCLHHHRTLHYTPQRAAIIIYACFILHNTMIDKGFIIDDLEIIEYDEPENAEDHDLDNFELS